MDKEVLDYISTQRVCVLAVEMPDGSPHAATVHFAFDAKSESFIIMTNPAYRKYEALAQGAARASLVIGTSEGVMQTLQLDGEVCLSNSQELLNIYLGVFPKAAHIFQKDVLFTFSPTWWRFTDWANKEGKKILTSDGDHRIH